MIQKEIAPGIFVYSDVISHNETLIDDIEEGLASLSKKWVPASVKEGEYSKINTTTRDVNSFGIPYSGKILDDFTNAHSSFDSELNNIFFKNFDPIEKNYQSAFGISTQWHDSYGILKYGVGQKFTNHIDDHPDYHRRISTVYYMNDNYSGGEISFPRFNITFKPKANQMIIFPSTYVYNHSVSPVLEGTRYAVVSWMK